MRYLLGICFCLVWWCAGAQIFGTVTDENGEPLPFTSIYVRDRSVGTSSNEEGDYRLNLSPGQYRIVFQYVGYVPQERDIRIGGGGVRLDISLTPAVFELAEVIVSDQAEDPAYAIIRKAIEKREYYLEQVKTYQCKVYIKGLQRIRDAPEKILGQEIGDFGGILDSNRQGIVYFSESLADYYVRRPNDRKEVMVSSKVSGNDNGFSFNSASMMDFTLYEKTIDLNRDIISPIAENAFQYYRYRLEGISYDEDGKVVNKIAVIPKRETDPIFSGHIYILEDLWSIETVDLVLTGTSIKQPILDSLFVRQDYVIVEQPDVSRLFSQTFTFTLGLLGFEVDGYFTGIFSDYQLGMDFPRSFFGNEIFAIEEGANERQPRYWDSIRPLVLTNEETLDYRRKDSLQKIWDSREYKDSVDAVNNRFKFFNLIGGYTYNKSADQLRISMESPINTISFNAVEGWKGSLDFALVKGFDEDFDRSLSIRPSATYSFGDDVWRGGLEAQYNFRPKKFRRITLYGGKSVRQFNSEEPISPFLNQMYSLFGKKHLIRLYESVQFEAAYREEVGNGLLGNFSLRYEERSPLKINSQYSFARKDREYETNLPDPARFGEPFEMHSGWIVNLGVRIRFQQRYMSTPDRKFIFGSRWPVFRISYTGAFPGGNAVLDYHKLEGSVADVWDLGVQGTSSLYVRSGFFLARDEIAFQDYFHFNGNQTAIGNPDDYLQGFKILPYYTHSTDRPFLQAGFEHHFNGYILDKIPLIRHLGWNTVVGANYLSVDHLEDYFELSLGFDNIGIGVFRFLRVDVVSSFVRGNYQKTAVLIGINL